MRRFSRSGIVKHGGSMELSGVRMETLWFQKIGHMPSGAAIYVKPTRRGRLIYFLSSYNKGEDIKDYTS